MANTPNLIDSLPLILPVVCPSGFGYNILAQECRTVSKPVLTNNMIFQNRAFHVDIVGPASGLESQQNLVALTPLLNQAFTGHCPSGANYWDVGVRGDLSPTDHSGGSALTLNNSIL